MTHLKRPKLHFYKLLNTLKLAELLRTSSIRKAQEISVSEVFKLLLLLVFQGKNLYRFLNSKRGALAVSKNTYYRFLNTPTYNWRRFLTMLSAKVISSFSKLTRPKRVKVFILDDSIVTRNRSKSVELLARVFDHAAISFKRDLQC